MNCDHHLSGPTVQLPFTVQSFRVFTVMSSMQFVTFLLCIWVSRACSLDGWNTSGERSPTFDTSCHWCLYVVCKWEQWARCDFIFLLIPLQRSWQTRFRIIVRHHALSEKHQMCCGTSDETLVVIALHTYIITVNNVAPHFYTIPFIINLSPKNTN